MGPGLGLDNDTLTGGHVTYPWMVFLYILTFNDREGMSMGACGGSMISDLQVLTAAHCVVGMTTDNIGVILGNQNALEEVEKLNWQYVYKIDIYSNFKTEINNPDVAVLTLENPVPLTTNVRPICLPSFSDISKTYEGVTGTVATWGLTEVRQEIVGQLHTEDVPIISNSECKNSYGGLKR